ncbi:MAG: PASTA domain-containing protein [Elusimicrobia bacterium]|nr:PASTA domain-containing protein [Elusimicrobiota bacterium]
MKRLPLLALLALVAAAPKVIDSGLPAGGRDVSDFPRPAGLTLKSYTEDKGAKGVEETATYHSEGATDDVLAEYGSQLTARGWTRGAHSDSGKEFHRVVMADWKTASRSADLRLYTDRKGGTDVWVRVKTSLAPASAAAAAGVAPSQNSPVVVVPSVVGKPTKDAEWTVRGAGFAVDWAAPRVVNAGPGDHADRVAAQDPAAGQRAARGSAVVLTARHFVTLVPDVVGLTRHMAGEKLRQRQLQMQTGPGRPAADPAKVGTVAATQPGAGEKAAPDSTVTVTMWELAGPVPDVVGKTVAAATAALQGRPGVARFTLVQGPSQAVTGPGQMAGHIAVQDPAAGTVAMNGSAVRVNTWETTLRAPDLVGQRYQPGAQAGHGGGGAHFDIQAGPPKPTTDPTQAGKVAEQSPAAGQPIVDGGVITVSVWTLAGPVPNVVGKTYDAAAQALRSGPGGTAKFVGKSVLGAPTPHRAESERVASQSPAAGTAALDGSTVILTLPALEQKLPDLVGGSLAQAQRRLEQLQLQAVVAPPRPTNDPAQDDRVAAQTPAAGTILAAGGTVTVTVYRLHPPE